MKKQAARLQSVSTEKGMIVNAVYSDGRTLRVNLSEVGMVERFNGRISDLHASLQPLSWR